MEMLMAWIRRSLGLMTVALPVAAVGCGPATFAGEESGETSEAVASGATNISDGIITNSMAESETAAVALGGATIAVAYNSGSSAPHTGERCFGYSQLGMSYNSNGSWRAIHFAVPSGVSALRGDPSIAALDNGSDWRVFVSSIAHSTDTWNVTQKLADGCISLASYGSLQTDRLCLITVSVPKNGAAASVVGNPQCATGGDFDGTAATVISGTAYFATWSGENSLRMFRGDGVEMPAPLGSQVVRGHPIFVKNDPTVLVAPNSSGVFFLTVFTPSPSGGSWSTPLQMGTGFNWTQTLPYGIRFGKSYAAVTMPVLFARPTTYLFYLQGDGRILGRAWDQQSGAVTDVWHSRSGFSAFGPALAVATIPNEQSPYPGFHAMLSYWDNGGLYGSAALNFAWIGANQLETVTSEMPCLFSGYWGDYDEMVVQNNFTTTPTFVRSFTDSTAVVCNPGSDWDNTRIPQHVSIIGHAKF